MEVKISSNILVKWTESEINSLYDFIRDFCLVKNTEYEEALKMWRSIEWIDESYTFYKKISTTEIEFTRWLRFEFEKYCLIHNLKIDITEEYKSNEKLQIESKIEKLREYQLSLEKELDNTDSWFILVPTWGWKTVVMINEIAKKKERTFLLIHNTKLLYQFISRLKHFSNIKDEDIWIYWDWKKEIKPVTIALMQSFWKLSEEKIREITSQFDLFFIDETHHLVANTLMKIW